MKKAGLFIILSFAVLLGACRKDWTCTCRNPILPTNAPAAKYPIEDKTKSQAKKVCDDYEKQHVPGGGLNCTLE